MTSRFGVIAASLALVVDCGSFGSDDSPAVDAGGAAPTDAAADEGGADAASCSGATGELVFTAAGTKPVSLTEATATNGPGFDLSHASKACPIALLAGTTPRWATVVLNATGRRAQLEAFGACTMGSHDINVVAYRRSTPPESNSDLADCAQASTGFEGNNSEMNGGSGWCKGLLAKDGQALALEPCERAVVVFEYGTSKSTPPPTGNIRLE